MWPFSYLTKRKSAESNTSVNLPGSSRQLSDTVDALHQSKGGAHTASAGLAGESEGFLTTAQQLKQSQMTRRTTHSTTANLHVSLDGDSVSVSTSFNHNKTNRPSSSYFGSFFSCGNNSYANKLTYLWNWLTSKLNFFSCCSHSQKQSEVTHHTRVRLTTSD